jgi:hypothetical protein
MYPVHPAPKIADFSIIALDPAGLWLLVPKTIFLTDPDYIDDATQPRSLKI